MESWLRLVFRLGGLIRGIDWFSNGVKWGSGAFSIGFPVGCSGVGFLREGFSWVLSGKCFSDDGFSGLPSGEGFSSLLYSLGC